MNIQIFGTETCTNCKEVLRFLESKGADFSYKLIGTDVEKQEVEKLAGRTVRSVPVIVVNNSEVSFTDLRRMSFSSASVLNGLSL